jgi:hypothetical protein
VSLFIESDHPGDFNASIKITNTPYVNGVIVSRDASFGNVHRAAPDIAPNTPQALGLLSMKIKPDAAPDFKSLPADKISDCFLLVELGN